MLYTLIIISRLGFLSSLKLNSIIWEYIHFCWQERYRENSSMIWLICFPPPKKNGKGLHACQGKRELLKARGNLEMSLAEVNESWAAR